MKNLAIILLSATLSTTALGSGDKVVATYKGGEVKETQIMEQFKTALEMQPENKGKKFADLEPNLQEALVRGYVNFKLIEQEAKNSKVEDTADFQAKINNIKQQMIQQTVVENYLKTAVTDKMIDEEYNKVAANLKGKEERQISHILLDSESKAKEVKKKLSKGGNFAALAKEFSKDEGSKANGGDIGFVLKGQLVPEFEDKAFSMKINEISDPVKTSYGVHIIKVTAKRPAVIPSKEEAKQALTNKLSKEALEKYLADLASKADVKINLPKAPEKASDDKGTSKK